MFGNIDVVNIDIDMEIGNTMQVVRVNGVRDDDPEVVAANGEAMKLFGMVMLNK